MSPKLRVSLLLFAGACAETPAKDGSSPAGSSPPTVSPDIDGDGVLNEDDCAPEDPTIFPGADEGCDGIDTDCDGAVGTEEQDRDGDGFFACAECDDTRADVYPGATEVCDAARTDEDCNGLSDDLDPAVTGQVGVVPDGDGDGFGPPDGAVEWWCVVPDGFVEPGEDCDDTDPAVFPGAAASEPGLCTRDADGDGFGDDRAEAPLEAGTDCDDTDASRYPGASEVGAPPLSDQACDGVQAGAVSDADYVFWIEDRDAYLGWDVSSVGDIDGDGLADVVMGSEEHVFVFTGASLGTRTDGVPWAMEADITLTVPDLPDVTAVGDVDGDGLDDVLAIEEGGDAYLLRSADYAGFGTDPLFLSHDADALHITLEDDQDTGSVTTAVGLGDLDGDGLGDFLIGSPKSSDGGFPFSGQCAVVLGSSVQAVTAGWLSLYDADYVFVGEEINDNACQQAAAAGDVDGDGLADLLISAPDHGEYRGRVYLFYGATLAAAESFYFDLSEADLIFESSGYALGTTPLSSGDIDGDGLSDLIMSERYAELPDRPSSYIVLGRTVGTHTDPTFDLDDADHRIELPETVGQTAVVSAGDLDGDGRTDLLLTDDGSDAGGEWAGAFHIFLARSLLAHSGSVHDVTDMDYSFVGTVGERLAASAAPAGDVDGDGRGDLLIGSPLHDDEPFDDAGRVYLLLSGL